MQDDEIHAMVEQMLAVMARIDSRDQQLTQQVTGTFEAQNNRWVQTLSGQVEGAARAGLEPALTAAQQRVQALSVQTEKVISTMAVAQRDLASVRRWVWIGAGVCVVAAVAALVGTYAMLFGHYQTRYDELKSQVTYLDALNHSDVVPCGEGRLCARINDKAQRLGDKKQYRLIEPRQ